MSIMNKPNPNPFAGSRYIDKVEIDFDGLPNDIINYGILTNFENRLFMNCPDSAEWNRNWKSYLTTIPEKFKVRTIKKGIEYGKKALDYYLKNEYNPKVHETWIQDTWQRRIELAEDILIDYQPTEPLYGGLSAADITSETGHPKEFTTARQVLAINYLLDYCKVENVDRTAKARFIQFITGKESGASNIRNTTIYKRLGNLLNPDDNVSTKDLQFIRVYFEDLGLFEIAKMIQKEISKREFSK
jgi:hypothetical protein